jgi:hypothetical protein
MRSRTKWVVAGGAAALVISPVLAVYGSPTTNSGPEQRGLVIDAEAANRARSERLNPTPAATPSVTAKAKAAKPVTKPDAAAKPTGKKTVSAVSPISPKSPKSPDTPG